MKRTLSLFLCCALTISLLAGCAGNAEKTDTPTTTDSSNATELTGVADNEIFTYDKIDPDKTTITVARVGNIFINRLCRGFMEQNPDIQVVQLDITGGNNVVRPFLDWLSYGYRPDAMIMGGSSVSNIVMEDYFEDITANPVVSRYEVESLNNLSVDGKLYALPGPATINGLYYNKTMFEQYGWQVPTTMDDFIALCQQIEKDTDGTVQAWNPSAKYEAELISTMEAFTYTELLGGVENRSWYNEFLAGNATFASHMQPFFDLYQRFLDAGIFKEEYFTYSATTRAEEFKAGKIAMINFNINKNLESPDYEFAFVPFPTTVGNDGYLVQNSSYIVAKPIKERTEAQEEATQKFLDYISTPEAQQIYIDTSIMISSLKDFGDSDRNLPQAIKDAKDAGHMFTALTFRNSSLPQDYSPQKLLRNEFLSIFKGEKTAAESLEYMDAEHVAAMDGKTDIKTEVVATAAEDFTILETSNYFADMFRETADADIALVLNNAEMRGNLMRIFKGELTDSHVTTLKPRSLNSKSTLIKVSMTGKQLLDALNRPYRDGKEDADCVYAVSGLQCTVAPWNEVGSKVLSVTMADGTAIDESKLYTVAIWQDTVYEEYITEVLESYEGTFEELLTAKLKEDQTISPAKDGRMELKWD